MTGEETTEKSSRPDAESRDLAMSRMKEEIEAIAKSEATDVVKQADEEAKQIIDGAKKEAERIKKGILDEAKSEAEKAKVREISRKKLAIKMDYLQTRESVLEEIIVEAQSQLQKFTKSKDYPGFLENLVKSSAISIGGGNLNIQLRKEDKSHFSKESLDKLAKEVSKVTAEETSFAVDDKNLDALGGIRVVRNDNKLYVDNTFESRLERKNEQIRVSLLEALS